MEENRNGRLLRVVLVAGFALLLGSLALRLPPVVDYDEPWRLAAAWDGRLPSRDVAVLPIPTPAPYGYLIVLRGIAILARGDADLFLGAVRFLHWAGGVLFFGLLLDTARRLAPGRGALLLVLPALLAPVLWGEMLLAKEYLWGALLLLLLGRRLLAGERAGPWLPLAIGFVSPAAGGAAVGLWIAARFLLPRAARPSMGAIVPLAILLLLEVVPNLAALPPVPGAEANPGRSGLARAARNLPLEAYWYLGGWLELPLAAPLEVRLGLALAAALVIPFALARPEGRFLLASSLGLAALYLPLSMLLRNAFWFRYLYFYTWFWIPLALLLAPRRTFPAVLFFALVATNWIPRVARAPATGSYLETVRAAEAEAKRRGIPLVFTDQMHLLAGRLAGVDAPLVLSDTSLAVHFLFDPGLAPSDAIYRSGRERRIGVEAPLPERCAVLLSVEGATRRIYDAKARAMGARVADSAPVGRTAWFEIWKSGGERVGPAFEGMPQVP